MKPEILVFGEILWDVFGEEKTIGGAPFNFAAHAVQLGAEATLISAVGRDDLGGEALKACRTLGVDTSMIALVPYPTGYCQVTLHEGTPEYDLVRNVAYDHIPFPPLDSGTAGSPDVIYYGTLAQRGEESRDTLQKLIERYQGCNGSEVFFDINIRQNYYNSEIIHRSMNAATILKVSREEIDVFGIDGTSEEICSQIASSYPNLKMIIVTLDSDGAFAYSCADGQIVYAPKPECSVVSTVGAGDSFSAGFIMSLMEGCSLKDCLKRASLLAGYVVTQPGAVPQYSDELKKELGI